MKEIYWITVLGNVGTAITLFSALFISVCGILLILCLVGRSLDDEEEEDTISFKFNKVFKGFIISISVFIASFFIPSKQDMYLIYGVGGTIDYLKENPHAKNIPDNILEYLDNWTKELNENKKENQDESN